MDVNSASTLPTSALEEEAVAEAVDMAVKLAGMAPLAKAEAMVVTRLAAMALKVVMAKAAHLPDRAVMVVKEVSEELQPTATPLSKVTRRKEAINREAINKVTHSRVASLPREAINKAATELSTNPRRLYSQSMVRIGLSLTLCFPFFFFIFLL